MENPKGLLKHCFSLFVVLPVASPWLLWRMFAVCWEQERALDRAWELRREQEREWTPAREQELEEAWQRVEELDIEIVMGRGIEAWDEKLDGWIADATRRFTS